jgi:hypothetical protein
MKNKTETLTLPCGTKIVDLEESISIEWKKEKSSWTTHILISKDFIALFDELLEKKIKTITELHVPLNLYKWDDVKGWV